MPIEFRCSQCQKLLRTGDETAGKKAKCPECGTVVDIPQKSTAGPSSPAAGPVPGAEPPSPFGAPPQGGQGVSPGSPFQGGPGPSGPAAGGLPPFGPPPGGPANPYQSPGSFVPGPSPSLMPQGPVQPTPIDMGDVINRGWAIFKEQMGICIGASLIVGLISNIPNFIRYSVQMSEPQLANDPVFAIGIGLFSLVWIPVSVWLGVGQVILFLKVARGQPAEIGDIFTGGPFLVTAVLASILFGLAYFVGICLCIVPGIIVALMFSQFLYLIVDQRLAVIESLSVSNQITTGNKATLFLLWLVLGLIAIGVTIFTCCIGLLFVGPFINVTMAVAYLTMTGQPTAEQMQMQMPPGPRPMV